MPRAKSTRKLTTEPKEDSPESPPKRRSSRAKSSALVPESPPKRRSSRVKSSASIDVESTRNPRKLKWEDIVEQQKDKYGDMNERLTSESIINDIDLYDFATEYANESLEMLKNYSFNKYTPDSEPDSIFIHGWNDYVSHASYGINYYMREGRPEDIDLDFVIENAVENAISSTFEEFISYRYDLDEDEKIKEHLNPDEIEGEKYKRRKRLFKEDSFEMVVPSAAKDAIDNKTLSEKLDIIINVLEQSFVYGRLLHELNPERSFVRVTDGTERMYRGIINMPCDSMDEFINNNSVLNQFLSITSDLRVAVFHTTSAIDQQIDVKDAMSDSRKKIIIEYEFEPGITLIDINKRYMASESLKWQQEFVIPPGVKMEVIEKCRDYPIRHVTDQTDIEKLQTDEQGRKLYVDSNGILLPVEETVKYMKVRVSNPSAAKVGSDLRIEDIEGKELGGKRMKSYSSKMRSKSSKKRRTYKIRK